MSKKAEQACRVDIGGQAVMEGVMMKSPDAIAVAVRRPDQSIVVKHTAYEPLAKKHPWMGKPFLRGMVNMVYMLVQGMRTLQDSTNMLGMLDEEPTKFEKWLSKKLGKGLDKIVMGTAVVLAILLSMLLFVFIPEVFGSWFKQIWPAPAQSWIVNLLCGVIRILILIGYILFCGKVPDVRRTFQYHGAEHKTVYCHEHELPLTPENAQQFSTLHPRCGTSFLLIVMVISILLFTVVGYLFNLIGLSDSNVLFRFLTRLLLLPVVAGISYEVLKGLAHSESALARVLRWPGMQLQRLTTKQPTDDMLECAIVAMNVALHGMPDCEKTPEGYGVLHDYRVADPDYVPPEKPAEEAPAAEAPSAEPETTQE